MIDEEDITIRVVKVKPYGSYGVIPVNAEDCPYRGENACVSSSGESFCGGLYEEDMDVEPSQTSIRCIEDQTFSQEMWDAIHPDDQTVNNNRRLLEKGML